MIKVMLNIGKASQNNSSNHYPFLLVDRDVENRQGTRGLAGTQDISDGQISFLGGQLSSKPIIPGITLNK